MNTHSPLTSAALAVATTAGYDFAVGIDSEHGPLLTASSEVGVWDTWEELPVLDDWGSMEGLPLIGDLFTSATGLQEPDELTEEHGDQLIEIGDAFESGYNLFWKRGALILAGHDPNQHLDVSQHFFDNEFQTLCACGRTFTGDSPDDADAAQFAHRFDNVNTARNTDDEMP